jgi:hypothetical protein
MTDLDCNSEVSHRWHIWNFEYTNVYMYARARAHAHTHTHTHTKLVRGCIQKFPDCVDNEIYVHNNKHSLRSNTKCYGGETHYTDSQNSDTTASSGRELHHLQFSLQAASPETFGYTLISTFVISLHAVLMPSFTGLLVSPSLSYVLRVGKLLIFLISIITPSFKGPVLVALVSLRLEKFSRPPHSYH